MTARQVPAAGTPGWTVGAVVAALLGLSILLAAWFFILDGGRGRPVTVNEHTDNAVPTVDRLGPGLPVIA